MVVNETLPMSPERVRMAPGGGSVARRAPSTDTRNLPRFATKYNQYFNLYFWSTIFQLGTYLQYHKFYFSVKLHHKRIKE